MLEVAVGLSTRRSADEHRRTHDLVLPETKFLGNVSSRRTLLRNASAAVSSILLLPVVEELRDKRAHFDRRIGRLTLPGIGTFEAEANPLAVIVGLLAAGAAIVTIAEYFGIRPRWATGQPDCSEASQCKPHFDAFAEKRLQAGNVVTDVQRSPANHDVAMQSARPPEHSDTLAYSTTASPIASAPPLPVAGSVQFGYHPAFELTGRRAQVVAATGRAMSTGRLLGSPSQRDLASSLAVTKEVPNGSWTDEFGQSHPLTILRTAAGATSDPKSTDLSKEGYILHTSAPSGPANAGLVWVHVPGSTEADNPVGFGLRYV